MKLNMICINWHKNFKETPKKLKYVQLPLIKMQIFKEENSKYLWAAGYKYSWRKMEVAAQDRAGWMETSGLWTMFHREKQGVSQVSQNSKVYKRM